MISVTSAMLGNTRVTWPTTPISSMTASPGLIPESAPRFTKSFCVNGSRPVYRTSTAAGRARVARLDAQQGLEPGVLVLETRIPLRGRRAHERGPACNAAFSALRLCFAAR